MRKSFWLIYLALLAAGLLAGAASAQQAPKPPEIPQALITKYFKAHSESVDASLVVIKAQRAVDSKVQAEQQVIAELQAVCGDKFQANLDAQGNPACVAKPESAKPEVKK